MEQKIIQDAISKEISKHSPAALGLIARIAAIIIFPALELIFQSIKDEQVKNLLLRLKSVIEEIVKLLTDNDKGNAQQIAAYFDKNGIAKAVFIAFDTLALLESRGVVVPQLVKDWLSGIK